MRHYRIDLSFNRVVEKDKSPECDSYDPYIDEHNRLGALKDDSEDLWEERTYQLSAGGLSLTFAVFSFLMNGCNGIDFHWPMAVIWGVYAICLLTNYLSQHISKHNILKLQESLSDDREKGLEYDENRLIERYEKTDQVLNVLNIITEVLLVLNIISTVVYTCILFCSR